MSTPDKLLSATRPLLPLEHDRLRKHIPTINRLGDLGIKWHRLGETGVTLIERGIYQRALKMSGRLAVVSSADIVQEIQTTVVPTLPHGRDRLTIPVTNIDYFGEGPYKSIAYTLESDGLAIERSLITDWLDKRNGVNNDWGEFDPHVSIATIVAANANDDVLEAFWSISPQNITVLPLSIKAA